MCLLSKKWPPSTPHHQNPLHQIKVGPNPARYLILITSEEIALGRIWVFDMMGRQVLKHDTDRNQIKLSVSHLPTGIYSLMIETSQGRTSRQIKIDQ